MLTLPDFKEKRILVVHAEYGQDNLLQLTNDNIRFVRDGKVVNQMSCHSILAVFIIGDMSITTNLIKKLISHGVSVFFLNHNLKTTATAMAEAEGNYLLRQRQYSATADLKIATNIVGNKIESQEAVLTKYEKSYDARVFNRAKALLKTVKDKEQLLGIEGSVGKTYFQSLFADIGWVRRAPQTKEDIANLLLDIGYTYLFNYCDALLRLFGFDTYKGYYHQLFFQRKSLVCDIMEPIRPIIDCQLLKSFHLKQIKEKDFVFKNGKFEFKEGFKTSKIYSSIFLEAINRCREDIYSYILDFYHYSMDDIKYKFPYYKI
ncbi:CRISPR-associated endonuclease Cas1 [Candidatus Daviesbacteria bacterium RIFCSPLOWO2_02_FULL_38_15]|uniref:CRISPR-associated endonuclease Cas1 n=1 Tax=Candidatus Daviesbacteria bacterium RIFCSPLOWO2_02_FULL_38_15 TaxID=1797794 RepID=A0A1F5N536_9BACT|nr:MAG: CRISPR-associated endonuclease Cas1 [Candidatus Daviesbacteria bacterium RIFCSPLOWO2_02_FULL_38_15]